VTLKARVNAPTPDYMLYGKQDIPFVGFSTGHEIEYQILISD
jgi:hypothetical protein